MESGHFNYFRVKNFKRFRDLEVKDIGQFNLVLGDNNVGKTSLLEALMFDGSIDEFILALAKRLNKRNVGDKLTGGVWEFFMNNDEKIKTEINDIKTDFFFGPGPELARHYHFSFNKVTKKFQDIGGGYAVEKLFEGKRLHDNIDEIPNPKSFMWPVDYFEPFISNLDRHDSNFTRQYSKLIQTASKEIEAEFIESLKAIDESIEHLMVIEHDTEKALITVESSKFDSRTLLAMYGDGLTNLFRVLLLLHLYKGHQLMLDEIDAGIYHGRMKEYWKVVLTNASENNVQIFASTHNRECIQAYQEALEELGKEFEDKSRIISLVEHEQTKEVSSVTYSFEEFQHSLMAGNEIR